MFRLRMLRQIVALLVVLTVAGCATSNKRPVVLTYQGTVTTLAAFQDTEKALYAAKTVPQINDEFHANFLKGLIRIYNVLEPAGEALKVWRTGEPVPQSVRDYFAEAERVLGDLQGILSLSKIKEHLVFAQQLVAWARTMLELAGQLNLEPTINLKQTASANVG